MTQPMQAAADRTAAVIPDRIPLGVALAMVTGRRVDRPEHDAIFRALADRIERDVAGGEPTEAQRQSEAFFAAMRARAAHLFPVLAHETGDELDGLPGERAGWLEAREAHYGATIAAPATYHTTAPGPRMADPFRDWTLTHVPDATLPPLQGEATRLQQLETALSDLQVAWSRWRDEYDRVLKAKYGYEWIRGEPAQNSDDLLAAEQAYEAASAQLVALAVAAMVADTDDPPRR